jgi:hypothetical protein
MIRGALKGSLPLSWVEEGPKLHKVGRLSRTSQGPYKDSGSAVFFFSFSFYSSFFLISQKQKMVNFFFGWKKLNLFALGKTNLPPLSPLFSIKFFLFSQKKHLCWKTIKKIQAFFS